MRFDLGYLVCTIGVQNLIDENEDFHKFVCESLEKYTSCDWGQTCDEDKPLNDSAVKHGDDRILAVYEKAGLPKIWIITEWDRSSTTILFPSEY